MDFNLTEDQQAFAETAKQFADQELAPNAARWDKEHYFPKEVIQKAGELGFCGLYCPEDQGGLGLSRLDSSIIFEQLAMGCTATTAMMTIHNMAAWMMTTWGTDSFKEQWSEALVTGQKIASYCLTEPGSGSDAASLRTTAKLEGDHYVVNGSKMFISGAGETDVMVVMVRTGGEGPKGISAIAIPAGSDGIIYGKAEEKMGWNAQPTRLVTFEDVRVPVENLLGNEGEGFKFAMKGLDGGRINIATCSVGTAQQALNTAKNYMHERQQFGKPLAAFQALQFKIADMTTELVAARQMVRLAAAKLDGNDAEKTAYCAMAKRFATDVGTKVCDDALQIHGGYGYIQEYPLERHLRDVRVHQILEGTNEIMRVIIGRRVLAEDAGELL
ncbi:acyl-CoA dehydrogenase family protein [Alteromonas sp. a30]|uniref:acyl-CoA dehydrogenase family protein n=1 Tax=Alteromonas sp. a30 TaxID=2730917 RepID=UPI0022806335|nr:acyl-CoA dehydrogenase family protein [Alteromonas sp. a30]MCY7294168.1 acyl-CoA dehydrogenase [Alteromonas sp. a30]